ncbi:MAG: ABC transporter ATP-binding protein [Longimicrobiales bacterium]|nr:ABC transporter ATP-binding protein [Longimicrobiales bacterium]
MTPVLTVRDLDVPFGDAPGLVGVSLEVGEGGRLALVGPSGSGKTSLLRALAGSGAVAGGTVRVAGADVTHLPPERRGTVLLSQRPLLFPHLTVFENVAFPLRVRGVRGGEVRRRVEEALASVRMAEMAGRASASLSGGQAHRVALARAVVGRPRLLLLDEPLSSLDPSLREEVRRAILAVQAAYGPAMILVTHDLEEAGRSAHRVAVLLEGSLAQVDTPEGVFRRPASPAVARFLGLPNELPGESGPDGLTLAGWPLGVGPGPCTRGGPRTAPQAGEPPHGPVVVLFGTDGMRIAPEGAAGLPGRVRELMHHPRGVTARVEVLPASGGTGETGAAPPLTCEVSVPPDRHPVPGEPVTLQADPARLHVFAE